MNALVLTLFVSALLFVYGLVQFAAAWRRRDHQHADRLSLLPLEDDDVIAAVAAPSASDSVSAAVAAPWKDPRHER